MSNVATSERARKALKKAWDALPAAPGVETWVDPKDGRMTVIVKRRPGRYVAPDTVRAAERVNRASARLMAVRVQVPIAAPVRRQTGHAPRRARAATPRPAVRVDSDDGPPPPPSFPERGQSVAPGTRHALRHRNEVKLVGVLSVPPSLGFGPDGAPQLRVWVRTREGSAEQTHAVLHSGERVTWLGKWLQQGDTVIVEGRLTVWRDKIGARSHAIVEASRVVLPLQRRLLAS